jgi:hypothetical protein
VTEEKIAGLNDGKDLDLVEATMKSRTVLNFGYF